MAQLNWNKLIAAIIAGITAVRGRLFWMLRRQNNETKLPPAESASGEVVEFIAGGISGKGAPYLDTFRAARKQLGRDWQQYMIALAGHDLSQLIGAFPRSALADTNPDGRTFCLVDLKYE